MRRAVSCDNAFHALKMRDRRTLGTRAPVTELTSDQENDHGTLRESRPYQRGHLGDRASAWEKTGDVPIIVEIEEAALLASSL
jgi:hypothetical protein